MIGRKSHRRLCTNRVATYPHPPLACRFINARVRLWKPILASVFKEHYQRLMAEAQVGGRGDLDPICGRGARSVPWHQPPV